LVRFFGKTTRAKKSTDGSKSANGVGAAAKSSAATAPAKTESAPAKKTPTIRRRVTRPPKRDWAAEAAATPVGTPAPKASSLAAGEAHDADASAAPAKRRRGTRGGRGRKKPGTAAAAVAETPSKEPIPLPVKRAGPLTLDAALERQAAALERFSRDVTTTLAGLQAAITDLRAKIDAHAPGGRQVAHPRVGIFVDVPNVIYAAERRNINIDFGRVLEYFTRDRELVRASAYAPITDDPQAKLENQRFVQHFVGHPYRIITKPLKRFADGSMKANFDIELAIDILTMSDRLDVVVLMSGDGDFRRLVELISSRGVRVEVAAFSETASSELKSVADRYVDIGQHLDEFKAKK
jgi:uncharacterized LabA/DUF88 family protein